jgi:hypothetical protein
MAGPVPADTAHFEKPGKIWSILYHVAEHDPSFDQESICLRYVMRRPGRTVR